MLPSRALGMDANLENLIAVRGLSALTMGELRQGWPVREAVLKKCDLLSQTSFADQELEKNVRLLVEVIRSALVGSYPQLSVLAFAHFIVALDYFLATGDKRPDTWVGGFDDDREVIRQAIKTFRAEIAEYERWRVKNANAL